MSKLTYIRCGDYDIPKTSDPVPQDGERKKPLQGRQFCAPKMDFPGTAAGLRNIKAAVPYALDKGVTTTR